MEITDNSTNFQNDLCFSENVINYESTKKVFITNKTKGSVSDFLDKTREKELLTAYINIVFTENNYELGKRIVKTIDKENAMKKRSKDDDIIKELKNFCKHVIFISKCKGLNTFGISIHD